MDLLERDNTTGRLNEIQYSFLGLYFTLGLIRFMECISVIM